MIERTLSPDARLLDAVRSIENSRRRIAVVVDGHGRLLGTLTDGDVRRCLLAGGTLETPVTEAMNAHPRMAPVGSPPGYLLDLMRAANVLAVPLVDADHRYRELVHRIDLEPQHAKAARADFEFAVIMAGGEGMRLRPLTENIPKPMVDIGGVPLLGRQIHRLQQAGIGRVYLSVNYLSHVIEDHFGDGSAMGLDIRYLREPIKLGTAGALSLLPETPTRPIVVMNGDILTTSDFESLHAFHVQHAGDITVAAVDYRIHIPFGVIQTEGPFARALQEKPSQRFLCNAGIYVVSPAALELVPSASAFNMTDLIEVCLARNHRVAVFPVHEYWSDIGTPADLEKARNQFSEPA